MEVSPVKKSKVLDFYSFPFCDPCKPALRIIRKVAAEKGVTVRVHKDLKVGAAVPRACITVDGKRECITGFNSDSDYEKQIKSMLS